ncbi:MAG TPA: hypothetical protein VGC37_07075 [Friedmanniella sp.]
MRILVRAAVAAGLTLPLLLAGTASASATTARPHRAHVVKVRGAVDTPGTFARAQLAALPQTTLTDQRPHAGRHALTGVLLLTLIDGAKPQLPMAKNAALRVTVTVDGSREVAVARGELDPRLGNHPALLVLSRDGRKVNGAPELVFPGDTDRARTVHGVRRITVAVAAPATTTPAEGAVVVASGHREVVLSAARLAALPQRTRTVTFLSGQGQQTRVETGPTIAAVLRAARLRTGRSTTVVASATDGYVAAVTPGETTSGGRPLLLSLVEDGAALTRPRLVVDGDLAGGRYVSDVTVLTVTGAHRR